MPDPMLIQFLASRSPFSFLNSSKKGGRVVEKDQDSEGGLGHKKNKVEKTG